jgi:hypothetical protein
MAESPTEEEPPQIKTVFFVVWFDARDREGKGRLSRLGR